MARPSVEAERREQILSAACQVISEQGFKALRVTDVARLSKVSTGTVHYYFETKRDLANAAFEWNFSTSQQRRTSLLAQGGSVVDRLRAFVDTYVPDDEVTFKSWRVWVETWAEALHDQELQALNERTYGEWRHTVADLIRLGQAEGSIVPGDPEMHAHSLVSLIDGLAVQVLVGSRHMTPERMRAVCHHMLEGMTQDPATLVDATPTG